MKLTVLVTIIIVVVVACVSMAEFYFQISKKLKEKRMSAPKENKEKVDKTKKLKEQKAKLLAKKAAKDECPIKKELKGLVKEENYNYDRFNHIETPYEIIEEKCESCGGVLKRGKVFYVCPVCGKRKKIL